MTEYEMISAAQGYVAQGATALMNFFTVLVAYLVAGYLMASRLSLLMALFLTGLFVAFSLVGLWMLVNVGTILWALLLHMHEAAAAGKDLQWAPIAQRAPDYYWLVGGTVVAMMIFAIVGAIVFFFVSRRST